MRVISHHGAATEMARPGSLVADEAAYQRGFRSFQVDAVAVGGGELVSAHAAFGRRRGWTHRTVDELRRITGESLATVAEILDRFADVTINIDVTIDIDVTSRAAEAGLIAVLERPGVLERVCVSTSFHRGIWLNPRGPPQGR